MLASGARRRIAVAIGLAAIAVAVAATVLGSGGGDGDGKPDRFTILANRLCRVTSQEIALAARRYRTASSNGDPRPFARSLFTAVGKLQTRLGVLDAPDEMVAEAVELHEAVFEWEEPIVGLIHLSPSQERLIETRAQELQSIDATVHERASALGLEDCARLRLNLAGVSS